MPSHTFEVAQAFLLAVLVVGLLRFMRGQSQTRFKERNRTEKKTEPSSAQQSKEKVRLLLQGVVLSGLPHQILNVREDASEFEIRKAHRNLIKRFHPDKVGAQGSREWYEAQRASEAINHAREEMLKKLKSQ